MHMEELWNCQEKWLEYPGFVHVGSAAAAAAAAAAAEAEAAAAAKAAAAAEAGDVA
jgi:hypothetical protein